MSKRFVRPYRRKKPKGGFTNVRAHARTIKKTVPTTVDDEIIDLMMENYIVTEGIGELKKQWTNLTGEITRLERGFGKGTPLARGPKREREQVFKQLTDLEKQQRGIRKQIRTLYEPLPQPQKSKIMTDFTKRFEEFRGKPLMG